MLWMLLGSALAQQVSQGEVPAINAQLFRPSVDNPGMIWADDSLMYESREVTARALVSYTNDPLVYTYNDGSRNELVSSIWQQDVLAGFTIERFRIGLDLPFIYYTAGSADGLRGRGDISADGKFMALSRDDYPVGLALQARLTFPTSQLEGLSANGFPWEVSAIVDKEIGNLLLVVNVGSRGQPEVLLENVEVDDQLFYRAGVGYSFTEEAGIALESVGAFTYREFKNPAGRPQELMLSGWIRPLSNNLVVRGGIGPGISSGVGAPRFRAVFALAYEPPRGPKDRDLDGVVDGLDSCPDTPEDMDQYRDEDGCPEPTEVRFAFVDGEGFPIPEAVAVVDGDGGKNGIYYLEAGGHDLSATAPQFNPHKARIKVPSGPPVTLTEVMADQPPGTVKLTVLSLSGEVLPDAGWTLDRVDQGTMGGDGFVETEQPPGTYRVGGYADGFLGTSVEVRIEPEGVHEVTIQLKPTKTKVTKERIELGGTIYFETNKSVIKSNSFELLDDVAAIMIEHPEITQVRIEGHTDERGDDASNMDLSERRAAAVRDYLIRKGVEADRLNSVGYGETRPVDPGHNEAAWEKNRRVDFMIEERSD